MKRVTLTPTLSRRIIRDVSEGVPPQVAARKQGVALETFLGWMSRKGRRYAAFQRAIDQAVAVATAENVLLLKRATKRGKFKAALTWLQTQAPTHFPPRAPVNIGTQNNLIALIQQMQDREGTLPDPRLALVEAREREPAALPSAPEPTNNSSVYEPNVISDREPTIVEMIAALPP
jgi:hypothetical protein